MPLAALKAVHESTHPQENPDFSERKELLKEQVKIQAKLNVESAIKEGKLSTSTWYLERRAPDEFAPQSTTKSVNLNINADAKDIANPKAAEVTQEYQEKSRKTFEQ